MKTLITALVLSVAAIVPLTADAGPRTHVRTGGQQILHSGARQFPHARRPKVAAIRHIYWQSEDIGTDPDRNIRYQMRRDADLSASNH